MRKKAELPCYEVYVRTDGQDNVLCTTCVKAQARRMYIRHCSWGSNPRIRVDGQELTIAEADRLMLGKGA